MSAAELHARTKELFLEARELPRPAREALLDERCARDPELRRAVEALLGHDAGPSLLVTPRPTSGSWTGDLDPGTTVGEYVIEAPLGGGGFGNVYRARHPVIGKAAAVKVLGYDLSRDPAMVSRFVAEARAVNKIGHSVIVDIFAFGQLEDGRCYHVMELVDGDTLGVYLRARGRLEPNEALDLMRPIGRALDAAAAEGVTHRDLKPANILVGRDEEGRPRPRLLDFGIAKLLGDEDSAEHRTATGAAIGTPAYMSPEQCNGARVDHRSDIYAFGVVLFELLTGRAPFEGPSQFSVMSAHVHEPAPDPCVLRPELSPAFGQAVLWLLEKNPEARPQSLEQAFEALEAAAAGRPVPTADIGRLSDRATLPERPAVPLRPDRSTFIDLPPATGSSPTRRWGLWAAGLGMGALAAGLAVMGTRAGVEVRELDPEPPPAAEPAPPPPIEPEPPPAAEPAPPPPIEVEPEPEPVKAEAEPAPSLEPASPDAGVAKPTRSRRRRPARRKKPNDLEPWR